MIWFHGFKLWKYKKPKQQKTNTDLHQTYFNQIFEIHATNAKTFIELYARSFISLYVKSFLLFMWGNYVKVCSIYNVCWHTVWAALDGDEWDALYAVTLVYNAKS